MSAGEKVIDLEIEWKPNDLGSGYRGLLGGIPIWSMSWIGGAGPKWWLGCSLPGIKSRVKVEDEAEAHARAERQLETFLTMIGARR